MTSCVDVCVCDDGLPNATKPHACHARLEEDPNPHAAGVGRSDPNATKAPPPAARAFSALSHGGVDASDGRATSHYGPDAVGMCSSTVMGGVQTGVMLVGSGSRRLRLSPAETKDSPGDARGKGLSEHPPPSGCPRELTWVAPRAWAERRDIFIATLYEPPSRAYT